MDDDSNLSFVFQVGLMRDQVSIERSQLTLGTLKDLACSFINRKFPGHGLGRLSERLILFRHDYSNQNQLALINSAADITTETLVEIVLNATLPPEEQITVVRPHELDVHSYRTPTFCDSCGEMLFGLMKQGLQCRGCNQNFHKRCVSRIPNGCQDTRRRPSASHNLLPVPLQPSPSATCSIGIGYTSEDSSSQPSSRTPSLAPPRSPTMSAGRGCWAEGRPASNIGLKIPHTFVVHTYTRPTMCHSCRKLLKGLLRQGMQCRDCKLNVHKKCSERIQNDCIGEAPRESHDGDAERDGVDETESDEADNDSPPGSQGKASPRPPIHSFSEMTLNGEYDGDEAEHDLQQPSNIPVQRLWQSVKHTKRKGSQILKEGWMIHCTNKDPCGRLHYWRLDPKSITLYHSETNKNFFKEIPLSEILAVETAKSAGSSCGPDFKKDAPTHCFELRTANVDYYVGQDKPKSVTARPEPEGVLAASPMEKGFGTHLAKSWETAIRQALMPVTPQSSTSEQKVEPVAANGGSGRLPKEPMMTIPPGRERGANDITQLYEIAAEEVLGSGQFGVVYGGVNRKNKRPVAIKIIDKTRFPHKNDLQLKNEVSILQNISHPGIVILESMYETPERIYVVMEKLKGDMLEMILSSPIGRLSERTTRFLITQILVALKHLHSKNIVHCDLKPENVLLSEDTEFPQVKLCDFGFARIIGEKSFRRSVVGTPAYLAPEVIRNKKYNRSLDMWSVGVIVYVSLSGTFPFNEEEDIHDQIKNAAFMYPPTPWKEISTAAVDLVNHLLQVQANKRYTVDKTLMHPWLQDYHTWCDCRELESKVGFRYITHESDDERWEQYRRRNVADGAHAARDGYSFTQ